MRSDNSTCGDAITMRVRPHSALGDRTPNEMRQAYEATEAGDTQVSPLRLTIDRQTGSQPDEEAPRLNVALV